MPHTVTLFPAVDATDPDGNPVRRPSPTGVASPAFVQPRRSVGDTAEATTTARAAAYLPPSAPELDAYAQLEFTGARWELVGAATAHDDAQGVRVYWRADLRRVT
ncbi:hypothetical protein [Catellatospora sp. NPDC049609]|uniref:hypothetical protein n=1 Tax=Catellatospora sp. NPDC049609 TaxID=3155505 RepID=UPI00341D11F6